MDKLNKHQIDYIVKHLEKNTKKEIAAALGIDRRLVSDHIRKMQKAPGKYKKESTQTSLSPGRTLLPNMSPKTRTILCAAVVFIAALTLRLLYLKQLSSSYFFVPFSGGFDDYIFDNWALEILKGNWLGDKTIYIYRMPLYVYFLSSVYFLLGHSYWAVYVIQAFIGAFTCSLIFFIARDLFDTKTGLVAGLLSSFYGPFIFYCGMLVGASIGLLLICVSFLLLMFFKRSRNLYVLFLAGATIGLSILARGNMLIVLPFICLWLIISFRKTAGRHPAIYIAILSLGVLVATSPIIARNYVQERDFVPITALGGLNIYIGNAYGASGGFRRVEWIGTNAENMIRNSIRIAEEESGRPLKPSGVSNFWIRKTLASIEKHGPVFFTALLLKKIIMVWNAYEPPDIWDYYFFREYIPVLRLPLISFALISPLSLLGIYLSWPKRRELALLYLFIAGYMLSLVLVFITSRYRTLMVPFLIVLSSYAITRSRYLFMEGKNRLRACTILLIAIVVFTNLPMKKVPFQTQYNSLGILLKRSGKIDAAIDVYKKAINMNPTYPTPYYNLGILYRDTGRRDLAREYLQKAIEIAPDFELARRKLAELG